MQIHKLSKTRGNPVKAECGFYLMTQLRGVCAGCNGHRFNQVTDLMHGCCHLLMQSLQQHNTILTITHIRTGSL